jgi:hypothetical protein
MTAWLARTIEQGIERFASAIFAVAAAFAACAFVGGGDLPLGLAGGLLAASAGYPLCRMILAAISETGPTFGIPAFDVADLDAPGELLLTDADRLHHELVLTDSDRLADELLLTEADRLNAPGPQAPLVLDDILEAIGPDSRVVRLFDRRAMPTPGDLQSRIDSHVEARSATHEPPDAAHELSEALAELRKALR